MVYTLFNYCSNIVQILQENCPNITQIFQRYFKNIIQQAQLGVPHLEIQVELDLSINWDQVICGFILQAETCQIPNFA